MIKPTLASLLFLSACASTPAPRPIILVNSQFTCTVEPLVPDKEGMSDATIAVYITRLQSAGDDCRRQLQEIKTVLITQGAIVSDVLVIEDKPKKKILGLF